MSAIRAGFERTRPVLAVATASFRADPWRASLSLVLHCLGLLGPVLYATFLRDLAAAVGRADGAGTGAAAAGLALSVGAVTMLDRMAWQVSRRLEEATSHYVDCRTIALVAGLPGIDHHERSEHLDRIELLSSEQWLLSMSVPALLRAVAIQAQVVGTVIVLAGIDARLLLLPLVALPSVWAGSKAERIRVEYMKRVQPLLRESQMLREIATAAAPAKEIRVFGLQDEILGRYRRVAGVLNDGELEHRLQGARLQIASRVVFVAGYMAAIAAVAAEVARGRVPVADLLLTTALAGQVMNQLGAIAGNAAWLGWTLTAVKRYLWLLDYAAEVTAPLPDADSAAGTEPPARLADGIRLEGVSFAYPGTERLVLDGVDLHIPAGTTLAVVGDNGAGKTTLVKLLTRMYEPTTGRITVDGTDLRHLDVEAWRRRTSAAFQDHARLELVARRSVGVGDLDHLDDDPRVLAALDRGGSEDVLSALPSGLDTRLGPVWDDGVDLSGGQWQRLAIGRGMMRDGLLLLVLDEPTAALDAETEHRLFARYAEAAAGSAAANGTITVLVSHRFSTVRTADLIVVVADGGVAEMGSHDDLMAAGGLYSELYSMQARAYR